MTTIHLVTEEAFSNKPHKNCRRSIMYYSRYTSAALFITFFVCLMQATPVFAQAQLAINTASSIESAPSLPGPFTDVVLTLNAYTFDPSRTTLTWYVNGILKEKGIGLRKILVKMGPAGTVTTVQVVAEPTDSAKAIITKTFRPAYTAIMWEAQTYTPPFYKGKALASRGSTVTYIAMPFFVDDNGKLIDPSTLVYNWKNGYANNVDASGYGKQTYTIANDLRNGEVSVEVSTLDKQLRAKASLVVPRIQPFIGVYALNPLLGIKYENAISNNYTLSTQESTVVVEPYFFSVPSRESGNLLYDWTIGTARPSAKSSLVLRSTGTGAGTARITLLLRHARDILQSTRRVFDVQYGSDTQGGGAIKESADQQDTYAPF